MDLGDACDTIARGDRLPDIAAPCVSGGRFADCAANSCSRDRAGGWADIPLYPRQATSPG